MRPNRRPPARSATLAGLLSAVLLGAAVAPVPAAAGPVPAPRSGGAPARIDPALLEAGPGDVGVVVRLDPGADRAVHREVDRLGGQVLRELPLVDGFAARLPARAVRRLAALEDVAVVSADQAVHVQGGASEDGAAAGRLAPRVVRAPDAWSAGATGQGVTVAVVDTGISALPDLEGRIVAVDDGTGGTADCYDLSGEGHCRDSYGHGTFMAGLIAGDGTAGAGAPTGAAPDARLLSVKVAGADGAADVSTVLAAVQWVVSFRDRYDIRVLNLSLGTDSTQSWQDDPLNYAVERAWDAGILVVVAAANTGPAPGSIAKPADDPWVVTVGATDPRGTPGIGDDTVPDFSSRGPTRDGIAKPDVVAPGARVLSLRAPDSTLERAFPPADPSSPYRTGSGTSMAAAVVSGVAATALEAHPALTPDELKHALRSAARPVASDDPSVVGTGLVDAAETVAEPAAGRANAGLDRSTGLGSLGASRGSHGLRLDDPVSTLLTGGQTAQLLLWDPVGFTTGSWTPQTWYVSPHATVGWHTAGWAGNNWTGNNWTGNNWTGSSWYGVEEEETSYGRYGPGSASYGAWD
jgi:serine protease AprX